MLICDSNYDAGVHSIAFEASVTFDCRLCRRVRSALLSEVCCRTIASKFPSKWRLECVPSTTQFEALFTSATPGLTPRSTAAVVKRMSLASSDRYLRSADTRTCVVLRTNTRFGDRSFSTCGPKIWNSLPSALSLSFAEFKQHHKSYLFNAIWDRGAQRHLLLWAPYKFLLCMYVCMYE